MISQFANPVIAFSMNHMLIEHLGNVAVNAYSVITYASSLFSSLMWGIASGLQPLYGASYGAKDDKSLKFYFRSGQIMALVGGAAIFLLTFFVGKPLCAFFGADAAAVPIRVQCSSKILFELCVCRMYCSDCFLPVFHKTDAVCDIHQCVQKYCIQFCLH